MNRVAMMQPHFLPWLGYFELFKSSDTFVVLDSFQLSRQSWSTRNRLFVSRNKTGWISLDIDHSAHVGSRFTEAQESKDGRWRQRLSNVLRSAYREAPFLDETLEFIDPWISQEYSSIAELEIELLMRAAEQLELEARILKSSELDIGIEGRSESLRAILNHLDADQYLVSKGSVPYMSADGGWEDYEILVQDHEPIPYLQANSSHFVERLAFLDAVLNVGWKECSRLIMATKKWEVF